ncbi:MAG: hypothetical protein KatS3mg110_0989 [Pirellulaceae bacterium]|nr:MAG: hypothetical protein KatS3mg110_0989 [Pirellulaceae bacterium]
MASSPNGPKAWATAVQWLSVATTVAGVILAFGWLGHWLDQRLGTRFLVVVGFLLGLVSGMGYLLAVLQQSSLKQRDGGSGEDPGESSQG